MNASADKVGTNSDIRHANAALLSITHELPPEVVTSDYFDEQLAQTYKRLRMPKGLLERLAGISTRRGWAEGQTFEDGVVAAAEKAIEQAGIDRSQIGLLINASVTRDNFEPAVSVGVHDRLELPRHALNFDITNACLGFVNAMTVASTMIDAGAIDYALIVAGEDPSPWHRTAVRILNNPDSTRVGCAGSVCDPDPRFGRGGGCDCRADRHPEGHRIVGSVSRAALSTVICASVARRIRV